MIANDMEHATLVDAIIKAARGQTAEGKPHQGTLIDTVDLIREISPKISAVRDEAVAEELDRHSGYLWEAAKLLESTYEVLNGNGDEQAAAIVQGQMKTLQDVSMRLGRRAAAVRGVSPEELAARGVLLLPADAVPVQTAPPAVITPTLDDGSLVFGVVGPGEQNGAVVIGHQVCGQMESVADFDEALAWRNEHLPKCPGPPLQEPEVIP